MFMQCFQMQTQNAVKLNTVYNFCKIYNRVLGTPIVSKDFRKISKNKLNECQRALKKMFFTSFLLMREKEETNRSRNFDVIQTCEAGPGNYTVVYISNLFIINDPRM